MKQPYVTAVIALAVFGCDRAEDMKSTYPASKFDLTHWSLTLPVDLPTPETPQMMKISDLKHSPARARQQPHCKK